MKKVKYIIIGMAALMFAGCKDFFEPESPSSIAGELIYTSPDKIENAIHGVYHIFNENNSYRNRLMCGYQGLNTDIEFNNKTGDDELAICAYNMNLTNARVGQNNGGIWSYLNIGIERCTNIIEGIEEYGDLNNARTSYYLGETLTLRAFLYSEMIKLWGDVPARFESVTKNPDVLNTVKTDRNVIFDRLRIDLKRAAELMPWAAECPAGVNNTTQRPSKAFALALLARIDLNYAGYALRPDFIQVGGGAPYSVQLNTKTKDANLRRELYAEAMWACGQIVAQEDFKFKSDFEDIFRTICQDVSVYSNTEVIFAIPCPENRGQFMNYNCINVKDVSKGIRNYAGGSTNACQRVMPTLYYDYDPNDKRRDVTIAQWLWSTATPKDWSEERMQNVFPGYTTKPLYQSPKDLHNMSLGKFRVEWMSKEFNSSGDDGVDFPIVRYTDVMLMYCEASLGGITGDVPAAGTIDAQQLFDRVRQRAGLESKPLNMENLMEERKFELCGEYVRKYDLQRWGLLKTKLVETRARLDNLIAHSGEFAQVSDTLWVKFKRVEPEIAAAQYLYQGEGATADAAFVIDSIYGRNLGENTRPAYYKTSNGWCTKSVLDGYTFSQYDKEGKPNFLLYKDADLIDKRQLWPIFASDVAVSNGTLWNDYDY